MTFGKTIKKLRLKHNMTQEKLAELLNISPQAVSRWETNAAMPDISLLPPLANLFCVTTDYLLGMETYEKDLRKEEYDAVCSKYWQYDDKEKNYQMAVKAVEEYPGNMDYMEWLAAAEYYIAFIRRGTVFEDNVEEFRRFLDSSIKHYKIVLENTTSVNQRDTALNGIVVGYHFKGDLASAKQYALTEEDETKRNELLIWCLEGEEKRKHCQTLAEENLTTFLASLEHCSKTEAVCNAIVQIIYACFPDSNYQDYHGTLSRVLQDKSFILCREKRYDEAIKELQKARHHAEQFTLFVKQSHYQYTSPLFDLVGGKKMVSDRLDTPLDGFKESLINNNIYDPIRGREEFQALMK